ncbi:MAG: hypothetical protein HYX39_02680 [Bacteroidetes bacterium]|nr:hypothetical protein [Bacteroidota bacterium]
MILLLNRAQTGHLQIPTLHLQALQELALKLIRLIGKITFNTHVSFLFCALAPEPRAHLAKLGLRALVSGTLASYLSATIAGMLL